jgi:hypothetical protein
MIGLIVKGATALFMEGNDPGPDDAVAVINRYKMGNMRSWTAKISELNLEHGVRPSPLSPATLAWAYVFVIATEADNRRLEPGPFDDELAGVVREIEARAAS